MPKHYKAAEFHAIAATRHEKAARCHHEASRPFTAGRNSDYWAHRALWAHGHTLGAGIAGNTACKFISNDKIRLRKNPETAPRFPANALEAAKAMATILKGTERHIMAANHHEAAALHHGRAAFCCAVQDFARANSEAELAHAHAEQSAFHSHAAARHHVEHYIKTISGSLESVTEPLSMTG